MVLSEGGKQGERGSSQSFFKKFSPLKMIIGSPSKKIKKAEQFKLLTSPPAESQVMLHPVTNNASPFSNITNKLGPCGPANQSPEIRYEPIQSESPTKKGGQKLETPHKGIKYDSENQVPPQAPIASQNNPLESSLMKSSPVKRAILQHQQVVQTSTEVKVNVLEYENQQLKTQIEMLRSALLNLCNNPNNKEPIPFFAQQQLQMMNAVKNPEPKVEPVTTKLQPAKTHSKSPLKRPENYQHKKQPRLQAPNVNQSIDGKVLVQGNIGRSPHRRLPSNVTVETQSAYGTQTKETSFNAIRRRRRSQRQSSISGETPQTRKQYGGAQNHQISGERDVSNQQKCPLPFDYNGQLNEDQKKSVDFCAETECKSRLDGRVINQVVSTKPNSQLISQQQTPVKRVETQTKQAESNLVSHDTKFYENVISNLRTELEQFEQEEQKIISQLVSGPQNSLNNKSNSLHSRSIDQAISKAGANGGSLQYEMNQKSAIQQSCTAQNSGFNNAKNGYENNHQRGPLALTRSFTPCQDLPVMNNHRQSMHEESATDLADNEDHRFFEEIEGVILEEEKDDEDSIVVQQQQHQYDSSHHQLKNSPSAQEKRMINLQEVFQFIQSQQSNPFREETRGLIRPIKITSPQVTAIEEPASRMFANINIAGFQQNISNTNLTMKQQHSPNKFNNKTGVYMASPVFIGEDSTPQCSALLKNPGLQTSPSPDTRNRVLEIKNLQGLSLKSHSWMAASQKINEKDASQGRVLELRNFSIPNLSHQQSNVSDNTMNCQEQPTPKVIPYNPDFLADSATTNNQLRVKSPARPSVTFEFKPFIEESKIQDPREDNEEVIDLIISSNGNNSRVDFMNKIQFQGTNHSSGQNSEKKLSRKMDRSESIKRAEEMLTQFMKEHRDGQGKLKRPEFMRNKTRGNQNDQMHVKHLSESTIIDLHCGSKTVDSNNFSFSPLVKPPQTERNQPVFERSIEEEPTQDKVYLMQEAINNISFQMPSNTQQQHQLQRESNNFSPQAPVPEIPVFQQSAKPQIPRISYHDIQMYDGELINLEINPSSAEPKMDSHHQISQQQKFAYEMQTQNFKSFDDQFVIRESQAYSPAKRIVPYNHFDYQDDDLFLQPQIIKMSAHPTPASIHGGACVPSQQQQQAPIAKAFDCSTSFDNSKSPQSSSQRKKLSTQHKLKKVCSTDRVNCGLTNDKKANNSSSASKNNTSMTRKQVPSKSPSRGATTSTTQFINKQPSQVELAGASLVSNAIFLAKQLQSLQQPFLHRPKTAEALKSKKAPQDVTAGVINSARQSLLSAEVQQQNKSSFLHEDTRNHMQQSSQTTVKHFSKTVMKGSGPAEANTPHNRKSQSRSFTRLPNNAPANQTSQVLNSSRGQRQKQHDVYGNVQVPDYQQKNARGPLSKNNLTDLSVCSNSSGTRKTACTASTSTTGKVQKRATRESLNPEINLTAQKSSKTTSYQSTTSLGKPTPARKSAVSSFKASKLVKKPTLIGLDCLDTNSSFINPSSSKHHDSHTPTVSASYKAPGFSAVKRLQTGNASAQRKKKADAVGVTAQSFIHQEQHIEGKNSFNRQYQVRYNNAAAQQSMIQKQVVNQPSMMERCLRPGQQQVKEYYQLKREHERLRKIMQQQQQQCDLNSSGKFQLGTFNGSFIRKTAPQQSTANQQQASFDVRETAHFEPGRFNGQNNGHHFQQQIMNTNQKHQYQQDQDGCENCELLKGRGLSTRFCLDHSMDNNNNQLLNISGLDGDNYSPLTKNGGCGPSHHNNNEDLVGGCSIVYIDE